MKVVKSEFESASPYTLKPVPVAGFIILNKNSVETVSRSFHYRKPVIVRSDYGWYIRYSYRIPVKLRPLYDGKEWHFFRIKEDMNRRKGADREVFAQWLRDEIEKSLAQGYNPFAPEGAELLQDEPQEPEFLNATNALELFLEHWAKRGLEPATIAKYTKVVTRFMTWLAKKGIPYIDIIEIKEAHVQMFLNDMKKQHSFGNREFNNHYDFLRTAFNFLLKKKYISESPIAGVDKLKSKTTKHRYYDDKNLNDIIKVLGMKDPYILLAFKTVYYLCVRSEKELKHLKVGNINWEQNKVLADETKGGNERYIPMDENLKELFLKAGIDKYPSNYYVFGTSGKPNIKPFGRAYFAKKFRILRDAAGLNKDFTLYGAKHTRVCHLKMDGVNDADIMSLTGHKDFTSYTKYLRDIGLDANLDKINKVSRKI